MAFIATETSVRGELEALAKSINSAYPEAHLSFGKIVKWSGDRSHWKVDFQMMEGNWSSEVKHAVEVLQYSIPLLH